MEKVELGVVYCPTHLMLADYFKNTLQGALFHKSRYIIMGILSPYIIIKYVASYSSKERVENQIPGKQIPLKNISIKKVDSIGRAKDT